MSERQKIGPYTLYRRVGDGGMGEVHLAKREQLGASKWVAVKTIHAHLARKANFVASFLDEARVAMALNHPNVTQVFDLGQDDEQFYLAMEYVHGETLQELMELGPIAPHIAAKIMALASEGLHHAHQAKDDQGQVLRLVHRDVSPQNIFLSYEGHVKVTDFGIAWAKGRRVSTKTGHVKGKMAYMPIEQLHAKEVDRRTDVFAIGVVLWELLTGRFAFRAGTDAETIVRITQHEVDSPRAVNPDVPEALSQIVMKAMSQSPDDRFDSARQLSHALEDYIAATGLRAGPMELSMVMSQRFTEARARKERWLRGDTSDSVAPATHTSDAFAPTVTPASIPSAPLDETLPGDGLLPPLHESENAAENAAKAAQERATLASKTPGRAQENEELGAPNELSPMMEVSAPSAATNRRGAVAGALVLAVVAAVAAFVSMGSGDASLRISTSPSGATVFVDGVQLDGTTPVVLAELASGRHELRAELQDFEAFNTSFDMADEELSLRYELSLSEAPAPAEMDPTLDPEGVDVPDDADADDAVQDGAANETETPEEPVVDAVSESASMREHTMRTRMRAEAVEPATQTQTMMTAPRAMGRLTVLSVPWAQYRIVGTSLRGRTPFTNLAVPAGRTVVELQAQGSGEWVRRVITVEEGQTASFRHTF